MYRILLIKPDRSEHVGAKPMCLPCSKADSGTESAMKCRPSFSKNSYIKKGSLVNFLSMVSLKFLSVFLSDDQQVFVMGLRLAFSSSYLNLPI